MKRTGNVEKRNHINAFSQKIANDKSVAISTNTNEEFVFDVKVLSSARYPTNVKVK